MKTYLLLPLSLLFVTSSSDSFPGPRPLERTIASGAITFSPQVMEVSKGVVLCDGMTAYVLTPNGPGTNGTWYLGTNGPDVIVGTSGNDRINGRGGADRICLLGGDDEALGGPGQDRLFGDAGNDRIYGQAAVDYLEGGAGADVLRGGDQNDQLIGGTEADSIAGGSGIDILTGGSGADELHGGIGPDQLFGEADNDLLRGGPGNDQLDGGTEVDDCDAGGQSGDTTVNCEAPSVVVHIAAGSDHVCVLTSAGAAYCWGRNDLGQLGDGTLGGVRATPVLVTGGHSFVSLTAGEAHTCGVDIYAAAWCWGDDGNGQVGDGVAGPNMNPTPIAVVGGPLASLTAGPQHTCGLTPTGEAYCWGIDDQGELGDGTFGPNVNPTPGLVSGGITFSRLTAGGTSTCGVDLNGGAWCWGTDPWGELGDGQAGGKRALLDAVTGSHIFAHLKGGIEYTCGVDTNSLAWCWGADYTGQLGYGTTGDPITGAPSSNATPGAVVGGYTFASLAPGQLHTCGVRANGDAYCWGDDTYGELGDGVLGAPNKTGWPVIVAGNHSFVELASGTLFTCGVDTDGAVWCWGDDSKGTLGDGTAGGSAATPGAVVGL